MEFQIITKYPHGGGSYDYFTAKDLEDAYEQAEIKSIEMIEEMLDINERRAFDYFFTPEKPRKTLQVVEYDKTTQKAKRGGIKFKLRLGFLKRKYRSGAVTIQYWYKAVKIAPTLVNENE